MCREAIDAVIELEHFGLPFNRTPEGRIDQRRFGGHTRNHGEAPVRRACYAADRTGHMILQTLYQQCVARDVTFFDEFQVLDVAFADDDARRGAAWPAWSPTSWPPATSTSSTPRPSSSPPAASAACSRSPPTPTPSPATAPACSTGAACRWRTWSSSSSTPPASTSSGILLSEAARGEGGILRNADGERFMERYAPTVKDLAPRDMVSRAILTEIREGRGAGPDKDYVYLDLTHLPPEQIDEKLPDITDFVRTYLGIEPKTDLIPIQPTAHYAMGGIPTNVDGRGGPRRRRHRRSPASTPPASAPACRSTAPTGWAPTRCSTSSSSAAGAGRPWPRFVDRRRPRRRCPTGAEAEVRGPHRGA